jgi:uncharacterized protein involved in cysteine biosynthesis
VSVNPNTSLWIGAVLTLISTVLTAMANTKGAVPADWVPYLSAWAGIFATVSSAVVTFLHAISSSSSGVLVAPPNQKPPPTPP